MALIVNERWESRRVDDDSAELEFWVGGTDDAAVARVALRNQTPILYDGLVRQHTAIDERIGEETWQGTVRYGRKPRREVGDSSFQFDTGGGTQHVKQSLETVGRYGSVEFGLSTAPDVGGAIGVTSDSVEGVEITVPVYNFSETHYIAAAAVTEAYKATLFWLTGRINQAAFRGFSRGEVLFLGAAGSQRGEDDWEISYRWAASPNVSGLTIGDMTGIDKGGWDYLWCRYREREDEEAHMLVLRPIAVYVERVYEWGNFAALGIG